MKIVFVVTRSDNIGGSHIHIRDIASRLIHDGHNANVIIGGEGPVKKIYAERNIPLTEVPTLCRNISPLNDTKAYLSIKNHLRKLKPDLVSTHSSKAGFLGRLAANSLGIPVIFTAHGWSFTSGKSRLARTIYTYLEKSVVPITDHFITVSDYDKELALHSLNVNPDRIQTIHNGMEDIDPTFFAMQENSEVVNIVQVARFDNQKNHADLLRALTGFENIRIHFVGDGPLKSDIRLLAERLNLLKKITFYGRIDDVYKVLAKSDIFTLISNWEGFPRSTVEAMRAGLPVIVSDAGGAAEAVENGVNGFIVEKNDVVSLQKYLRKLIESPEMRKEMGRNSRMLYEKQLTFNRMYSRTLSVYDKVLSGSRD